MVFCINAVVADHFKVPVRDMYDQPFDKVNGRDAFCDCFMVLMALIMERHTIPVIGINPGSGNDRSSKISADVFNGDCKDTMSVVAGNEFTGHTQSAFLVIHVATGRTEAAFTGEGNKFKVTIMRAAKESAPERRSMAIDHPVDVIQNIVAGADDILDVFKVVRKNSLEDVLFTHKNILQ